MESLKNVLLTLSLTATVIGCGNKDSGGGGGPAPAPPPVIVPSVPAPISGMYTYMFRDYAMNCSTGRQSFNTLGEMCTALLDEALNSNCARFLRETDHLMRCRGQGGQVGGMPVPVIPQTPGIPMRNVWCSVGGKDYARNWGAMFNQRSNFRAILWNGTQRVSRELPFGANGRYGDASVILTPSINGDSEGRAEVVLRQDGGRVYSVKGRVSHSTRLQVDDARQETSTLLDCAAMDPNQSAPAILFQSVSCKITHRAGGRRFVDEKNISWSGQSIHQENLRVGPGRRNNLDLRLLPAPAPDFAVVEVESAEFDTDKRLYARGSLRGGFDFRHQDRRSQLDVQIQCTPQ